MESHCGYVFNAKDQIFKMPISAKFVAKIDVPQLMTSFTIKILFKNLSKMKTLLIIAKGKIKSIRVFN